MAAVDTIHVPHLWGIDAGYKMAHPYDPKKPTCILINSFTTSSLLYGREFQNRTLTDVMNLLTIEPLGQGKTQAKVEHFTFWDTAIMNLQVMDALGIKKAFAMGTSQGGFIAARMALLAPDRVSKSRDSNFSS
jgi:pimeloyl-ACP methyl ester carboxylesterase